MRRRGLHIILLLFKMVSIEAIAQEPISAEIKMWSDQQVYITTDPLWLRGNISAKTVDAKRATVRLIDRNGTVRAVNSFYIKKSSFSGVMEIPEDLISDFYFLDAYLNGEKSASYINPILIINPSYPANPACTGNSSLTHKSGKSLDNIIVRTDRSSYDTRQPVQLEISCDTSIKDISVTVSRNDRISQWMTDISRDFNSRTAYTDPNELEKEGYVVFASVRQGGFPVKNVNLLASLQGFQTNMASGITDDNGNVTFVLPHSGDANKIIISPAEQGSAKYEYTFKGDLTPVRPVDFPCLRLNDSFRVDMEERILNTRLEKRFNGTGILILNTTETDTTDFYGIPDQRYVLDDFTRFPNMEEVIEEFVSQVRVKKDNASSILQILNSPARSFFNEQGLILLDGVPITSARTLLDMNPLLIRYIDVVSRKFILGQNEFNGIVHFKSYKGDMAGARSSDDQGSWIFQKTQIPVSMSEPQYAGKNDPRPSLRNTLYWESDIQPDEKGKVKLSFLTSDSEGNYRILIRGINAKGDIITGEASILVKDVK
jgi:hypothetical protein